MYEPTHKQQLALVLWSQGFNARAIGYRLGVTDKAVYKRLQKVKKGNLAAYERACSIRRCFLDSKKNVTAARRYGSFDGSDTLRWADNTTGRIDELQILRKF